MASEKPLVKVAVIDPDPLRFIGVCSILSSKTQFRPVQVSIPEIATLRDVRFALLSCTQSRNPIHTLLQLKALRPEIEIVLTGTDVEEETVARAIMLGTKGYVRESVCPSDLERALTVIASGSVWLPRYLLGRCIDESQRFSSNSMEMSLTVRERQVLELLLGGESNGEIAGALTISIRTVKAHIAKLMRKAGVRNRVELSVLATQHSRTSAASSTSYFTV